MNNKASMKATGLILVSFIGIVVCIALLSGGIFQNIGSTTQTSQWVNKTYTFPTPGNSIVLDGQAATNVIVSNRTTQAVVPATNYTITNYEVSTGSMRSILTAKAGIAGEWNNTAVNISYTFEPLGYVRDSGTRSVIPLIAIFAVLGMIAFVIKNAYDNGVFDSFR